MQSGRMYCASPPTLSSQSPRGPAQSSSMQDDPSAYTAVDNSLSPSGEPSWWDTTVQWVQTHVPETILGALVTVGGIAVSVWAFKGRGGGGKKGSTPALPSAPSSNTSSNPPRSRTPSPSKMSDDEFNALEEKYNKLVYGHKEPNHGTRRIWGALGAMGGVGLAVGGTIAALAAPISLPAILLPLFGAVTTSSTAAIGTSFVAGLSGAVGVTALTEKGVKPPPVISKHFMTQQNKDIINKYHEQVKLRAPL